MRILIISEASSWMRGGVPAETRSLVQGLAERGHSLALACDAPLAGAEAALHIPLSSPKDASFANEVAAALSQFQPEFVHVICMSSRGTLRLVRVLGDRRWAMTMHSVPPFENKLRGWHRNDRMHYLLRDLRYLPNSLMWKFVFRRGGIPKVVAHSEFVESAVVRYGYPAGGIARIPLFFRPDSQVAAGEPKGHDPRGSSLLTVGGLTHTKGQSDVIKAMPALLKSFPRLTYHMIGEVRDESYVAYVRALASELGVGDRIKISSGLDRAALDNALASTDVYVQPSHEEGFCLAYAEATTRVARLVGTASGAIAAMSENDPGAKVVPIRRPRELAEAITAQLHADLPRGLMERRVERLTARFSYEDYVSAHERLYSPESNG